MSISSTTQTLPSSRTTTLPSSLTLATNCPSSSGAAAAVAPMGSTARFRLAARLMVIPPHHVPQIFEPAVTLHIGRRRQLIDRWSRDAARRVAARVNPLARDINGSTSPASHVGAESEANMLGYRQLRRNVRLSLALAGAGLVCGCSGAVHQLPQISKDNLNLAQAEVQNAGGPPARHGISKEEAFAIKDSVVRRSGPAADQLCREMNTGMREWDIRLSSNGPMNAYASEHGRIVVFRGIFETADNDEEVAIVVAH